jgi:broad specificity phosphatase PhoE
MRGWRRIGVVLSVFWFVGFGLWLRHADVDRAWKIAGYDICLSPDIYDDAERYYVCSDRAHRTFEDLVASSPWWMDVVAAALSVGALWFLAWIAVVVGRWVAVGFRPQA